MSNSDSGKIELLPYDSTEYFREHPDAQEELLADAVEQGHAGYLAHAIGIIARARGMTDMQEKTGMKRQALYRAFSESGNPTLETLLKMLDALDLKLKIEPATPGRPNRPLADAA
jgi:probable addiction module antidote protein